MAYHTLEPDERTLHGVFSPELAPVLTIDSGDTVRFRTLDAGWGLEAPSLEPPHARKTWPRQPDAPRGHALCGPLAIRGAEPGMTLEVDIGSIQPGSYGWTSAGGYDTPLNRRLGVAEAPAQLLVWSLDASAMLGRDQSGHTVSLRPFMGVMGMPPPEPGAHSTIPPRIWGGNIDCKELVTGSRLFLPIPVAGGLFSVGDGHAAQGDGEISRLAIECPIEVLELTFSLHADLRLAAPRAWTPTGWITFGFHEDLNEATVQAINGMLDLMCSSYGLQRKEALALASVVVDLRVTQIVNEVSGVHAILRHGALR